jgi:hypothetical protein
MPCHLDRKKSPVAAAVISTIPSSVISSEARNLVVPDRAKGAMPLPLSFRSEARNLNVHGHAPYCG